MFLNFSLIGFLVVFQVRCLQPEGCDSKLNNHFREGILGRVSMFPWLGVIRVKLYEGVKIRIALTGAVLIKHGYALAVADDIARIPKWIFQRDSQALFYPHDREPWLFKLVDRLMHPEYPRIKNSVALIKLELQNNGSANLRPVCWPTLYYNASDQLYVLGITDAYDDLEKEAYKVQYVKQYDCMVFYNKADLNNMDDLARDYQCAFAQNRNQSCIWETGMVLASNATGTWVMLGFGIRGPGCAAPGRFIEIYQYLHWIHVSTSNLEDGESFNRNLNSRKSGSRKSKIVDVPVHHFFRSDYDVANVSQTSGWVSDWYELGIGEYGLDRIDKNAIILSKFNYEADRGDCLKKSKLIYNEVTKIYADVDQLAGGKGVATYSISLMDLSVKNFSCVIIRVDAYKKSKPQLWFSWGTYAEPLEGYETPSYLLKKYPILKRKYGTETGEKGRRSEGDNRRGRSDGKDNNDRPPVEEGVQNGQGANPGPLPGGKEENRNNGGDNKQRPLPGGIEENGNPANTNYGGNNNESLLPEGKEENDNAINANNGGDNNESPLPGGKEENDSAVNGNNGGNNKQRPLPGGIEENGNPANTNYGSDNNESPLPGGKEENDSAVNGNNGGDNKQRPLPGGIEENGNPANTNYGSDNNESPLPGGKEENDSAVNGNNGGDNKQSTLPGGIEENGNPANTNYGSDNNESTGNGDKEDEKRNEKLKTMNLVSDSTIDKLTDIIEDLRNLTGSPVRDEFEAPILEKLNVVLSELNSTENQIEGYGPNLNITLQDINLCHHQLSDLSYYYKIHRVYFCLRKLQVARMHLKLMKAKLTTTTTTTSTTPKPKHVPTKFWTPHETLEAAYLTENPSRLAFPPFLNLLIEFEFYKEAELKLEVWSHLLPDVGTGTTQAPARTRFRHKDSTVQKLKDPDPKETTTRSTTAPPNKTINFFNQLRETKEQGRGKNERLLRKTGKGEVKTYHRKNKKVAETLRSDCDPVKLNGLYVIGMVFCTRWL